MKVRLNHKVMCNKKVHRFSVVLECPFRPERNFLFVFRDSRPEADDCALIVEDVYGWDATNQELLVRTMEWNIDEWVHRDDPTVEEQFDDVKFQLISVAGCTYYPP
ncbi:MAG: hypothetical protein ACFCD0_04080 [Gemmataceae bacterium]